MKRKHIIIGGIFVAAGLALCAGAFIAFGFDLSKFDTAKYETENYSATESFRKIEIDAQETDIEIKPSDGDIAEVVCVKREKAECSVRVEDGTLKIRVTEKREWYDYFNLNLKSMSTTVYLPSGDYDAFTAECRTGDFSVSGAFTFGELRVNTSTGDIDIGNIRVGTADLSVSTGRIDLTSFVCEGDVSLTVGTGKTTVTDATCKNFVSTGSTGDIILKNVTATGGITVDRGTGDVRFENCDAGQITVETSTGDVTGTFCTEKIFDAKTSTGKVAVPATSTGGVCKITTSTGDIKISIIAG